MAKSDSTDKTHPTSKPYTRPITQPRAPQPNVSHLVITTGRFGQPLPPPPDSDSVGSSRESGLCNVSKQVKHPSDLSRNSKGNKLGPFPPNRKPLSSKENHRKIISTASAMKASNSKTEKDNKQEFGMGRYYREIRQKQRLQELLEQEQQEQQQQQQGSKQQVQQEPQQSYQQTLERQPRVLQTLSNRNQPRLFENEPEDSDQEEQDHETDSNDKHPNLCIIDLRADDSGKGGPITMQHGKVFSNQLEHAFVVNLFDLQSASPKLRSDIATQLSENTSAAFEIILPSHPSVLHIVFTFLTTGSFPLNSIKNASQHQQIQTFANKYGMNVLRSALTTSIKRELLEDRPLDVLAIAAREYQDAVKQSEKDQAKVWAKDAMLGCSKFYLLTISEDDYGVWQTIIGQKDPSSTTNDNLNSKNGKKSRSGDLDLAPGSPMTELDPLSSLLGWTWYKAFIHALETVRKDCIQISNKSLSNSNADSLLEIGFWEGTQLFEAVWSEFWEYIEKHQSVKSENLEQRNMDEDKSIWGLFDETIPQPLITPENETTNAQANFMRELDDISIQDEEDDEELMNEEQRSEDDEEEHEFTGVTNIRIHSTDSPSAYSSASKALNSSDIVDTPRASSVPLQHPRGKRAMDLFLPNSQEDMWEEEDPMTSQNRDSSGSCDDEAGNDNDEDNPSSPLTSQTEESGLNRKDQTDAYNIPRWIS